MTHNFEKYVGNSRRKDASNATYKMLHLFITFEWIRSHKRLFLYANSFLWIDVLSDCFIPLFDFYKLKYREISSKALIYISIDLFLDFFWVISQHIDVAFYQNRKITANIDVVKFEFAFKNIVSCRYEWLYIQNAGPCFVAKIGLNGPNYQQC